MNDDVIILSDLDDSDELTQTKSKRNIYNDLKMQDSSTCSSNDLETFKVNCDNTHINDQITIENMIEKSSKTLDFSILNNIKSHSSVQSTNMDKEWNYSDYPEVNLESENNFINKIEKDFQSDSNYKLSSDDNEELLERNKKNNKKRGKKNISKSNKTSNEENVKQKEKFHQNKIKKQEEVARQKALKQLNLKNRLIVNPEYNIKLMEIVFDEELKNCDFFIEFLNHVEKTDIKYKIQSQVVPKCISWNRHIEENFINEKNEICSNMQTMNENHVVIIWDCKEIVKHIDNNTFISTISNIKLLIPDRKLSLIIYKTENYFKHLKKVKNQTMLEVSGNSSGKNLKKDKNTLHRNFSSYPKISTKKFEKYLVEIQLMYNISSKLIENQNEMVLWINQYTKSLALLPSKIEKNLLSKVNWHVNSDNRDTVKVDKEGNGLKRLWQQQLCQFNQTSLETSEAISLVYKSPLQLIQAYEHCSKNEGELLLKDISIRRAAGPVTSMRKIGPELSKKIFIMFTSEDGHVYLNN